MSTEIDQRYWAWRSWRRVTGTFDGPPELAILGIERLGFRFRWTMASLSFWGAVLSNEPVSTLNRGVAYLPEEILHAGYGLWSAEEHAGRQQAWSEFIHEQLPATNDGPHSFNAFCASRRWHGGTWGCAFEATA